MTRVDILTAAAFMVALLLGVMVWLFQSVRDEQPEARIRLRVREHGVNAIKSAEDEALAEATRGLIKGSAKQGRLAQWLAPKRARLETVSGKAGVKLVIATFVVGLVLALVIDDLAVLPHTVKLLCLIACPVVAVVVCYRFLVARFKRRFLDGFPDFLDLIVRAVRAGVPVTHTIAASVSEIPEPLRTEFRIMADSLHLGIDIESVLDIASRRIEIADFSFFCVCLTLQRETGGQLGETLENLAHIVRTRREIRQKTKAMTGETRTTTKILAAIPVVVLGILYLTNRPYTDILFHTAAGQKVATYSVISIAIGIAIVAKMSKLETSR